MALVSSLTLAGAVLSPGCERCSSGTHLSVNDRDIADFTKAIELDPNDAMAYNSRGGAYGNKGDYDRAVADCSKAIELKPNYSEAYDSRGLAHKGKGNYDQAREDFATVERLRYGSARPVQKAD